jgi:hypothetical protein
MCTFHSQNLREDSYLWLKVQKKLRLIKNLFVTHIYTFGSNVLLAFQITNFDDVSLTKVGHFYMVKGMINFMEEKY